MRIGFRGSTGRRLLLVGLAVIALCLIAVPVALAANPSMVIGGVVYGKYYGGQRALAAIVSVPGSTSAAVTTNRGGFFITRVNLASPPTYQQSFTPTAAALAPNLTTDWSTYFGTSAASFVFVDGGIGGVSPVLTVRSTRVSGTVRNAATRKALRGVKVTIVGGKVRKTSKKGNYSVVRGLWPATNYKVKFSKSGFKSVVKKFRSAPGSTTSVSVVLKKK